MYTYTYVLFNNYLLTLRNNQILVLLNSSPANKQKIRMGRGGPSMLKKKTQLFGNFSQTTLLVYVKSYY